jgi:acyl-CoA thioester hydrolase
MTDTPDLTHPGLYAHWHRETLRFSDTDMLGHINNIAFAALLESGRTAYTFSPGFRPLADNAVVVMARIEIDYRRELHWPGDVDVGTRVLSVGNTSFVLGQGLYSGAHCVVTGRTVLVIIDRATRRPMTLPPELRERLQAAVTAPAAPRMPPP